MTLPAVKNKLNGKTLAIQFVSGQGYNGQFDGNGIKLDINAGSNTLLHELFHAYQAYQETTNSYNAANLNLEIEAHYAQYLYLKDLPEYAGSKWENQYNKGRHKAIKKLKDYIDDNGKLMPGITSDVLDFRLMNIALVFQQSGSYKNKPYDYNRYGIANFKNLQTLTKGC